MFDQLFGRYLVASNRLTQEQLDKINEEEDQIRVRLGLIAVHEKYMTSEQAEEVNRMQLSCDKKFGDIAIEKKYLTQEQLNLLLSLQGNAYQAFVQLLIDMGYMTLTSVEEALQVFQSLNHFSDEEMDALKSCDVDRILDVYSKIDNLKHDELVGILIRTIIRMIDPKMVIGNISILDSILVDYYAMQNLTGDFCLSLVFCGENRNLLTLANKFADEEFDEINDDSLDSIGEFINCINGLYATALSYRQVDVNMEPPVYDTHSKKIVGKEIYLIPIYLRDVTFQVAIVLN